MALVKIISGEKNSGKTSLAARMVDEFRENGTEVFGFLSVSADAKKDQYSILDLESGMKTPAVAETPPAGESDWVKYDFSRFYFSESAFKSACGILTKAAEGKNRGVMFVDELGPLELSGHGCLESLKILLKLFRGTVYLVIRKRLLDDFIAILDLDEPEVLFTDYAQ